MKIGDRIFVRGYVDEIRKDAVIVRNDGGYFGTIPSEVMGELPSVQPDAPDTNVGDIISRQAAIDICHKNYDGILDFRSDGQTVAFSFEDIINSVPSVQPMHTNTPSTLKSLDCVDRQAVKEMMCVKHCTAYPTCQQKYGCYKTHDLELLPSVQPTYTDAEVQKMQDMHQVEIEKAFDLGRKDAKAEVIHCGECKHADHTGKDVLGRIYCLNHGLYWDALAYCSYAERRINETD